MRTESLPVSIGVPCPDPGTATAPPTDRTARGESRPDAMREPPGRRDSGRGTGPSFGDAMAVARRAASQGPAAPARSAREDRAERADGAERTRRDQRADGVARPDPQKAPGAAAVPGNDDAADRRAEPASTDADATAAQPSDAGAASPAPLAVTVVPMPPLLACAAPPSVPVGTADAAVAAAAAGAVHGKDVRAAACSAAPPAPGETGACVVAGADARPGGDAVGLASGTAGAAAGAGDTSGEAHAEAAAADTSNSKTARTGGPDPLHRRPGHEPTIAGAAERRSDVEARFAQIGAPAHPSAANAAASFPLPHVAAPSGTTYAAAGSAPPVFAAVPTPVGHPGFADRFAGEVSTLALRGIEQAEIVLNPRELGPVRIELSLNGEAARIAFSAAQPETRHAIEQTLPVLKDLLASHGLMLADTSVSDGRPDQGAAGGSAFGRAPAPPAASVGRGDAASSGAVAPRSPGLRGLVDLYA